MNDIADKLDTNLAVCLLADDCLIYSRISNQGEKGRFNGALKVISNWCARCEIKNQLQEEHVINLTVHC